ncbi:hypothetical protein D9611_009857 [Ephemerocybe angulata]|uniref:F-box domain-containing protein n=1 Tax=Ephemerocybe angulata TaxID=980116 RepID=A0A8H5CCQ2_9AGAR|nr:hypothetical protein D9611_009857 [Tulosesus angulatus]
MSTPSHYRYVNPSGRNPRDSPLARDYQRRVAAGETVPPELCHPEISRPPTRRESQRRLDDKIKSYENDLIRLKRRRNTWSPISDLPSEVLSDIFLLSFLSSADSEAQLHRKALPENVRLSISHISYAWRTVALNSPELWATIHIRDTTKTTILALALQNSKGMPIAIEAHAIHNNIECVRRVLLTIPSRVKSLSLETESGAMRSILPNLQACKGMLNSLVLKNCGAAVGHLPGAGSILYMPNLRKLTLLGWTTFTSPSSPRPSAVVHLEVSSPQSTIIRPLLTYLRNAPRLKELTFSLETESQTHEEEVGIELPRLEHLCLRMKPRVLSTFLSAIRVFPTKHTPLLATISPMEADGADSITKAQSIVTSIHDLCVRSQFPAPSILSLGNTLSLFPLGTIEDNPLGISVIITAPLEEGLPSACQVSTTLDHFELHTAFHPSVRDWWFSRLDLISIWHPPPLEFWKALARAPTLRLLDFCVTERNDCFLQGLRDGLDKGGAAAALAERDSNYPGLESITVTFKGSGPITWDVDYARDLALLLRTRVKKLSELSFYGVSTQLASIKQDTTTYELLNHTSSTGIDWHSQIPEVFW